MHTPSRNPWTHPDPDVIRFGEQVLRRGGRIVHDLGCGAGRHTHALAEAGLDMIASDIDARAVRDIAHAAKQQGRTVRGVVGSMFACPLAAGSLDGVVAFNVLYHAMQQDMEVAVRELHRTLRPGGLVYLTLAAPDHGSYGQGEEVEPHTFLPRSGVLHRFVDRDGAIALLHAFEIESLRQSEIDYTNRHGEVIHCVHWRIVARRPG